MRIIVVGAGAMGGCFGAMLHEAGNDVLLIDVWPEHVEEIKKNGLAITERDGSTRRVKAPITIDFAGVKPAELVIVFTKSGQTAEAAVTAGRVLAKGGLVLTLQNGLGNADAIAAQVDVDQVVTGTTAHGCAIKGPGHVYHGGAGATHIGPWGRGDPARLQAAAQTLTRAGIETFIDDNVATLVWNKLMVNIGINAIVALTGIRNQHILDLPETRELSAAAVREAMAVAAKLGIEVRADSVEYTLQVAKDTGVTRASMGQDVDARRQTEIMAINGAIARKAAELGLQAPVNQTLTALIRTREEHYAVEDMS